MLTKQPHKIVWQDCVQVLYTNELDTSSPENLGRCATKNKTIYKARQHWKDNFKRDLAEPRTLKTGCK